MSGFTVLAAVDFGYKVNYELDFPYRPSIPELRERVEREIGAESEARCPGRPFQVYRAQVFDERMELWADLVSPSQLENYCQVYVFQRESPYAPRDTPGRIPPPIKTGGGAPAPAGGYGSPPGDRAMGGYSTPAQPAYDSAGPYDATPSRWARGAPPPQDPWAQVDQRYPDGAAHSDKARSVHAWLCGRPGSGGFSQDEWQDGLEKVGVVGDAGATPPPFTAETGASLFEKADDDKDGSCSLREFIPFTELYPKLLDCLYYRIRERAMEEAKDEELSAAHRALDDLEKAREEAGRGVGDAEGAVDDAQRKGEQAAADLADAKQGEEAADRDRGSLVPRQREAQQRQQEAKEGLRRARDAERAQQQQHNGLRRAVDQAQKKQRSKEADRERAAADVKRLEQALEQAKNDLARKDQEAEEARAAADDAKQAADAARDPAIEQAIEDATRGADDADKELKGLADEEAAQVKAAKDAQRAAQKSRRAADDAERELRDAKAREQGAKQNAERAQGDADKQRDNIDRLEQEKEERADNRSKQQQVENELLQLEVRLREQREAVEAKEAHLRTAHRDFMQGAGRSPRRGQQ